MADRLQVTKSWLSRYLELARLPSEILACFGSHAAAIAPLLSHPKIRARVLHATAEIASEQQARGGAGQAPLAPAAVVSRLVQAGREETKPDGRREQFRDAAGRVFLTARREGRGGAVFSVPAAASADRIAVGAAIDEYLRKLTSDR
jgi:ParB family chromosome partitioning protein